MTDKLDAATIRELLAKINPSELIAWIDEGDEDNAVFIAAAPAIARYALELSDKVEELEKSKWAEVQAGKAILEQRTEQKQKVQTLEAQLQSQAAELERLRKALIGMVENFSEFPCDDTERWREEHQAYENALTALEGTA